MKLVFIGDPHGNISAMRKIPLKNIDVIFITGDLGSSNLQRKMAFENIKRKNMGLSAKEFSPKIRKRAFMQTFSSCIKTIKYLSRFAPVYVIFGNIESSNAMTRNESKKIGLPLPFLTDELNSMKNVKVINNARVNIQGINIGGLEYFIDASWVREFKPDNYIRRLLSAQKTTLQAQHVLEGFGEIDVLLCHQPPYGVLDKVSWSDAPKHWQGKHAGSKTILQYIKKHKPKYVFCGHIHESAGTQKVGNTVVCNLGSGKYSIVEFP
jgi:Icc-related predicted phosphoesterase